MTAENRGTNADGSCNEDYCAYSYKDGKFTQDFTMSQMIEFCLQFLDQINRQAGWNLTPAQAREQMQKYFPQLKRWKENDGRTLAEKAAALLKKCESVTIASVDANGYPRPVQMLKSRQMALMRYGRQLVPTLLRWLTLSATARPDYAMTATATAWRCAER